MSAPGAQRTYGVGALLGGFGALILLGIAMLVVVGMPSGSTEVLPTPQTLPEGWQRPGSGEVPEPAAAPEGSTATTSSITTTSVVASTTLPPGDAVFADGSAAPEGVIEVLETDEATSLLFATPAEVDLDTWRPAVAPLSAFSSDGFETLTIRVACAASAEEVLAQVVVTEDDRAVTVLAVVLTPPDGPPCRAGSNAPPIDVPLRTPRGDRALVVVPAGTPVPELSQG